MMSTTDPSDRFFAIAIAQALLRAGLEVFPEAGVGTGRRADLVVRQANGQLLIVEVKTASTQAQVNAVASKARNSWQSHDAAGKVAVAVGIRGTPLLFADEPLASRIRNTSQELRVHALPVTTGGYFELKRTAGSQFMFNLKAANHEVILTSERYSSKAGAEGGIASVKKNATSDDRFQRKTAKDNSPYFILVATNGEVIGRSEMYSSVAAMEAGIASVKANAPRAVTKVLEG